MGSYGTSQLQNLARIASSASSALKQGDVETFKRLCAKIEQGLSILKIPSTDNVWRKLRDFRGYGLEGYNNNFLNANQDLSVRLYGLANIYPSKSFTLNVLKSYKRRQSVKEAVSNSKIQNFIPIIEKVISILGKIALLARQDKQLEMSRLAYELRMALNHEIRPAYSGGMYFSYEFIKKLWNIDNLLNTKFVQLGGEKTYQYINRALIGGLKKAMATDIQKQSSQE